MHQWVAWTIGSMAMRMKFVDCPVLDAFEALCAAAHPIINHAIGLWREIDDILQDVNGNLIVLRRLHLSHGQHNAGSRIDGHAPSIHPLFYGAILALASSMLSPMPRAFAGDFFVSIHDYLMDFGELVVCAVAMRSPCMKPGHEIISQGLFHVNLREILVKIPFRHVFPHLLTAMITR